MSEATDDAEEADNFIGGRVDALLVAAVIVGLSGLYLVGGAIMDFSARQQMNSVEGLLFYMALFAMLALALNLHWGYTGLLNIGVIGFMAIGIYTTAVLSKNPVLTDPAAGSTGGFGLPLWAGVIGGVVVASLLGGLVALPALRLRADYFAIVTVGMSEIIRFILLESEIQTVEIAGYFTGLGGGSGLILDFDVTDSLLGSLGLIETYLGFTERAGATLGLGSNPKPVFDSILYVVILLVFLVGFYSVLRRTGNSPFGRVLKAIREDEEATKSLGKNTNRFKITAFMLGSGLMGLAGILFYAEQGAITPSAFRPRITFFVFIALIIGGAGSNTGSVLGGAVFAAFLFRGPIFLKNVITENVDVDAVSTFGEAIGPLFASTDVMPLLVYVVDNLNQLQLVFMGIVLVLIMQYRPQGILGHRKEPASPIRLTRTTPGGAATPTEAADGGRRDGEVTGDE
jgi:branched-chain amino acid transport system permease protein